MLHCLVAYMRPRVSKYTSHAHARHLHDVSACRAPATLCPCRSEFVSGLALNSLLQSRVRARDDPDEVLVRFREYLSQNSDMLR